MVLITSSLGLSFNKYNSIIEPLRSRFLCLRFTDDTKKEKRKIIYNNSDKKLKTLVDNVHKDIKLHGKKIKSKIIGETVLIHLKDVNEVAYLRFASVYKEFSDVTDFEKAAAELN